MTARRVATIGGRCLVPIAACLSSVALAQSFTQRGFLETRLFTFPQIVPGDSGRILGEALFRYEAAAKVGDAWQFAGALDARTDSHRQTGRAWSLSWQDRELQRPALAVRRLSATWHRGKVTAHLGKQFIRWGKTEILNPTDRFAPRDYLGVIDNDFLAVTGARVNVEAGAHTLDAVFVPRFTPSRTPLLGQRWAPLPAGLPEGLVVRDAGSDFPGGPQAGVRWSRAGGRWEPSLCYYEGFNHLPLLAGRAISAQPPALELKRYYPKMRMVGGDLAAALPWLTIKTEAAYFTSREPAAPALPPADEYVLYVVQAERLAGEWVLVGGYAGEAVTRRRSSLDFAPDRGFTRAFLGHAGYTFGPTRTAALDVAVRQNGHGAWVRLEYAQAYGQHWRAVLGLAWVGGREGDFLGNYRRNSHATLAFRYSF